MRQGLTPAQAYQAQVYSNDPTVEQTSQRHLNTPAATRSGRTVSTASDATSQRGGHESLGQQAPLIGFEPPDARLDLDFLGEGGSHEKGGENRNGQYSGNAGECC